MGIFCSCANKRNPLGHGENVLGRKRKKLLYHRGCARDFNQKLLYSITLSSFSILPRNLRIIELRRDFILNWYIMQFIKRDLSVQTHISLRILIRFYIEKTYGKYLINYALNGFSIGILVVLVRGVYRI